LLGYGFDKKDDVKTPW